MVRIYFNKFRIVSNCILDHVFDTLSVSNLSEGVNLKKYCTNLIFRVYVVNTSMLAKTFELHAIASPFCDSFENLKPGIDYNSYYYKIINKFYKKYRKKQLR